MRPKPLNWRCRQPDCGQTYSHILESLPIPVCGKKSCASYGRPMKLTNSEDLTEEDLWTLRDRANYRPDVGTEWALGPSSNERQNTTEEEIP